jgi:hypothetical protein
MRRLSGIVLLGFIGLGAAPSRACEINSCDPTPQGQPADILYYLLLNQPTPFQVRYTYVDTGTTAGLVFNGGAGPYRRVVREFRLPIIQAVCENDKTQFEAQMGIFTGPATQIAGELFEVLDSTTGARVGTLFRDSATSGVQATGDGLTVDTPYQCNVGGTPLPVLHKVAIFHNAFDPDGIDGATRGTIEREYLGPARARLAVRANGHMVQQNCMPITLIDFKMLVDQGIECSLYYYVGDPTWVMIPQPAP